MSGHKPSGCAGCFFPVFCSIAIVLVMTICLILDKQINSKEYPTLAPELPPAQSILESPRLRN